MKKNIYSTIFLSSLVFASCSKLDENPKSLIVKEQFYLNEEQAVSGVNAAYRKLFDGTQSIYNGLFQIGVEMATDDYEAGPRARNAHVRAISGLTHDPSNDRMEQLWKQTYDAINLSNIIIEKVPLIASNKISEEVRNRVINEAKFLRALHYFNLVRWFGGVPLVLQEASSLNKENLYVAKSTEEEVYLQIISDLTAAEALPNYKSYGANDIGRASSGAAKSLLAKVYLTQKNWSKAAEKAKQVIDTEGYDLFENFADVFNVATKNGKEHIFSAQFKGNVGYTGNSLANRSAATDIPGINGDYADALHTEGGLYNSYSNSDTRKAVTFVSQMVSPTNGQLYTLAKPQFHKYYDEAVIGNQAQSSKNLPIIRFSEVLLIYAEALNELNSVPNIEAYSAINKVRDRADISDLTPSLSKEAFRDSLFQERRKEFVYEYNRWFDLTRRGSEYYIKILKEAGKTLAAPRHIHFPTPQREIELNPKLEQHPDWINY